MGGNGEMSESAKNTYWEMQKTCVKLEENRAKNGGNWRKIGEK